MAVRNPTDFTRYIDESAFEFDDIIAATEPTKIYDDQVMALDAPMMLISDAFFTRRTDDSTAFGGVGAGYVVAEYVLDSKDMCGSTGVTANAITHYCFAYCWCENAADTVEVRFSSAYSGASVTVSRNSTSAGWTAAGSLQIGTNNNEDTITVEMRGDDASGLGKDVYCAGLLVIAAET